LLFKVKQKGLLEKYDEEIEGEKKQSFVLGEKNSNDKLHSFVCSCQI